MMAISAIVTPVTEYTPWKNDSFFPTTLQGVKVQLQISYLSVDILNTKVGCTSNI